MANRPCSNPALCGVKSHRAGTISACMNTRQATGSRSSSLSAAPKLSTGAGVHEREVRKGIRVQLASSFRTDKEDERLDTAIDDYVDQSEDEHIFEVPFDLSAQSRVQRWAEGRVLLGRRKGEGPDFPGMSERARNAGMDHFGRQFDNVTTKMLEDAHSMGWRPVTGESVQPGMLILSERELHEGRLRATDDKLIIPTQDNEDGDDWVDGKVIMTEAGGVLDGDFSGADTLHLVHEESISREPWIRYDPNEG